MRKERHGNCKSIRNSSMCHNVPSKHKISETHFYLHSIAYMKSFQCLRSKGPQKLVFTEVIHQTSVLINKRSLPELRDHCVDIFIHSQGNKTHYCLSNVVSPGQTLIM